MSYPFYPVGIYTRGDTNVLGTLGDSGFNTVVGPATIAFLDAARAAGLKVLATPVESQGSGTRTPGATSPARLDCHPALWAWYLFDEPDRLGIPPEQVSKELRALRASGARKPTALVLFKGSEALHYGRIADVTMVDRYPIPWLPLANFGQHVQMARLALGPEKPLIAVVQAFDWAYHRDALGLETETRPPTRSELRCMTYCALAERANGLFYFTYDDGHWKMAEHAETWVALQAVVAEVNERRPLFEARHLWWPKQHRFTDSRHGFNEALQSSITSVLLRVDRGSDRVPEGDYVLAVNNTDREHIYGFTSPRRGMAEAPVFDEDRVVSCRQGWMTDSFAPYAVHLYGPLPSP